jgi:hypothetical protein
LQHAEPSVYTPVGNDAKLTIFRHGKGGQVCCGHDSRMAAEGIHVRRVDPWCGRHNLSPRGCALTADPTGNEFFFYFFGGGSLCFIALLLLCVGRGRGRLLLVLIDLIGVYLWFAYVTFQAMLH